MEPINISYNQYLLYVAIINAAIGLLLGLIPLIIGIKKNQKNLGVYGFVGSIVGGAILGIILSIPIIGITTYLILKKSKPEIKNPDNLV